MAILTEFKKQISSDFNIEKTNTSIKEVLSQLKNNIMLNGRIVNETSNGVTTDLISLSATAKAIDHKLGRKIAGYLILSQDANAVIWQVSNSSEDLTKTLTLQASGNVSAKIWVF